MSDSFWTNSLQKTQAKIYQTHFRKHNWCAKTGTSVINRKTESLSGVTQLVEYLHHSLEIHNF